MKILIVTDAWRPQVNGVVRTLEHLARELERRGIRVDFLTPEEFRTVPMPTYPDIRLSLALPGQVARRIRQAGADAVHIATEGPLGLMARRSCLATGRSFTTSYHTRLPEYVRARLPFVPERWLYAAMRRFHNKGSATLVATRSLAAELTGRGFSRVRLWNRGVDTEAFSPDRAQGLALPRPIFLSVGRVAVEKNLPAFLDLDLPGSKLVVGDGPDLSRLKAAYPDVTFAGMQTGAALASIYASADVFVFPSLTDTFGNVILEALASGCPVAAYPVTGPLDILGREGEGGVLSDCLLTAAKGALTVPREAARAKALTYSWSDCATQFLNALRPPMPRHANAGLDETRDGGRRFAPLSQERAELDV